MGGRKLSDAKIIEIVDQKAVDELKSEAEKILNRLLTNDPENKRGTAFIDYSQVTCPHCNKTGAKNALARDHFNNCKFTSEQERIDYHKEQKRYKNSKEYLQILADKAAKRINNEQK